MNRTTVLTHWVVVGRPLSDDAEERAVGFGVHPT